MMRKNIKNINIIRIISVLIIISLMFGIGFVVGGTLIYNENSFEISNLKNEINILSNFDTMNYSNSSLSNIYNNVKDSIVEITSLVKYQSIFGIQYGNSQGSGFIYEYNDNMIVITNNHVVDQGNDIIVTFVNGNSYPANILGNDAYSDLAILSIDAPIDEFKPLDITDSSNLRVGDPVIAIGNPLGLDNTMTIGIVSQIERTITESLAGNYPIANIIQTSAAINPGNSGGPLLNYQGDVIGITTAIISNSEGLGFAIPSNTILKEISHLIEKGFYSLHPWLGISGVDMSYSLSKELDINVTYGWLIAQVISDSPAEKAGLIGGNQQIQVLGKSVPIGGDVIIGIDGSRVINGDYFLSYLEKNTTPSQIINLLIIRNNQTMNISVKLDSRAII